MKRKLKQTIGSDPECVLMKAENFVPALDYMRKRWGWGENYMQTRFGTDGHSATAEFRPRYGETWQQGAENCCNLIGEEIQIARKYGVKLYAGPYFCDQYLGGHVHIVSDQFPGREKLVPYFDCLLGTVINRVFNPADVRQRSSSSYGRYGDSRNSEHGTGVEYRTPPSWIVSPDLVYVVYQISYEIAANYREIVNSKIPFTTELRPDVIWTFWEKYVNSDLRVKDIWRRYILEDFFDPSLSKYWDISGMGNWLYSGEQLLDNVKVKGNPPVDVYIYGIRNGVEDVIIYGTDVGEVSLRCNGENLRFFDRFSSLSIGSEPRGTSVDYPISVGFSLNMRKNHPEVAKEILRYVSASLSQ